jgi:hypothetical protein
MKANCSIVLTMLMRRADKISDAGRASPEDTRRTEDAPVTGRGRIRHAGKSEGGNWFRNRVSAHELKADESRICLLISSIAPAGLEKLHCKPQRTCPDFRRLGDEKAQKERALFPRSIFPGQLPLSLRTGTGHG